MSRLARNNADWHRLLEICALTDTLVLDEDGIYDPAHFNDRLLLGLKGTMAEAEIHVLKARLRGGMINKARRGELKIRLPVGLVYDAADRVVLDPDQQVQHSVRHFFATYQRTGSAFATTRALREEGLKFPWRVHGGAQRGQIVWGELSYPRALQMLHNPRYAGAYAWGRRRERLAADGRRKIQKLPREEWLVLLPDVHKGYISWEQYEENERRLRDAAAVSDAQTNRTPPREGRALLQGLVLCGRCGRGMQVRYHARRDGLAPEYLCPGTAAKAAERRCQSIAGRSIDEAVGTLLCELIDGANIEVALAVEHEMQARVDEADRLRHQHVERLSYEADLARQRFMQVDPNNRLVADELEAHWNEQLRALSRARDEYERRRQADRRALNDKQRQQIRELASDFDRLWRDPRTPHRERKRMVRLLVEDVTLAKAEKLTVHVRLRGGATRSLTLERPLGFAQQTRTPRETLSAIDALLNEHTDGEIAEILNRRGLLTGRGLTLDARRVREIRRGANLRSRHARLRDRGLINQNELSARLGVSVWTIQKRRQLGTLPVQAFRWDDNGRYMYEDPGDTAASTAPRRTQV